MTWDNDKRVDAIWEKQTDEMCYWLKEFTGGLCAKNVSLHEVEIGGGEYFTIIYDLDDHCAVLIRTDTTAMTAEDSHQYMMIDEEVIAKLASIFNQPKP